MKNLDAEELWLLGSVSTAAISVVLDEIHDSPVFKVVKIVAVILSVVIAIWRIRMARPYWKDLLASDWIAVGQQYEVHITRSQHGRGRYPTARCLNTNKHGEYELVVLPPIIDTDGTVILRVDRPASLRLEVRK